MAMTLPNSDLDDWMRKVVLDPPPTPYHFNTFALPEKRLALIVIGVIFTLIGTFAITCRIATLVLRKRRAWYDDWSMIVAWVFSIAFMIASCVSVRWGVGLELEDAPPYWAARAIQAVYVLEIFYYFSLFFIKLSIVFLYLRLARELKNYLYKWSMVLILVLVLHFVSTIIVFSAQCVPMKKYWAPSTPGHCISITGFFYSTNVFTIVTDLVMLILPIPTIWKVPYSLPHKIGIMAAFLCGGISTIASCVRLYSIRVYTESPQPLRDAAPINTWSFIEINIGICCASIAVIRQFVAASRQTSVSSTSEVCRSGGARKRSNTNSTGRWFSTPAVWTATPSPATIARWPSPKYRDASDVESTPRDVDGTPIRQSMPLPPSPVYKHSSGGDTALPQKYPMVHAFVMWEKDGDSLTTISTPPKVASPA